MLKINKFILVDVLTNNPKVREDDIIESVTVIPAGIQIIGKSYEDDGQEKTIHLVIPEKECQKYGATVIKEGLRTTVE